MEDNGIGNTIEVMNNGSIIKIKFPHPYDRWQFKNMFVVDGAFFGEFCLEFGHSYTKGQVMDMAWQFVRKSDYLTKVIDNTTLI